ncbi:hypothetical protein [Xanthomonas arboricola]|uniref:hypothetical protein n=1 Tax=Xanthomonas sp. WHRI 6106 TaxID=3161566 RepID=UPI00161ADD1D
MFVLDKTTSQLSGVVWAGKDQWRWSVRTGFNKQLARWRRGIFAIQHTTGQLWRGVFASTRLQ